MWTASQQYVQGLEAAPDYLWSNKQAKQPQTTRLTCIKIDIQIRLIHADVDDHPSGTVNCYLEKARRSCLCASNSIRNYKNTKGNSFTRIKRKFSVDFKTRKSSF